MKKIIEPIIVFLLDWASGYFVKYFDSDNDKKVSKAEIKRKLGPNAKLLIKKLK